MSKAISLFRRKVTPHVAGCPFPMVDEAIRDSAIEFCDYTYTWREELSAQRVREGVQDYDIDAPSCGRLSHVLYVGHSDVRVLPATERTLDTEQDGWRGSSSEAAVAQWYYVPDKETIRLALKPSETEARALVITATFKPTVDADVLPNNLYDDHMEAVAAGALARLLMMPSKAWTDAKAAAIYASGFESAKRKERAERLNDYTRQSTLRVRPVNYYG